MGLHFRFGIKSKGNSKVYIILRNYEILAGGCGICLKNRKEY